ncbi:MAG: hypothetical protein Q7T97_04980 [Burkholderiaceae bacterium]|nr:hypothetical protein [Burkholderiaceae bacterium]
MAPYINPSEPAASARALRRRATTLGAAVSVALTVALTGCGGGGNGPDGIAQNVPSATQIADAQAALDGTVPTDDSITAKQVALDADADKDPD